MQHLLSFFSDLILFSAGLAVLVFWIVAFAVIAIESYDFFVGKSDDEPDDLDEMRPY